MRGPTVARLALSISVRMARREDQLKRIELRTAFFTLALAGLLASAPTTAQNPGKETGSLPETKAPVASTAAAQAVPASANPAQMTREEQIKVDWPWLGRFEEENRKLGPPVPGQDRVVFMGDSITQGWHLDGSFPGKPYINRGISGQTTPQMVLRFHQDVVRLQPKAVIILAGINDIAGNTGPMTLEQIEDNLAAMAEIGTANGIKVVLCSVLPAFDFPWRPGLAPAPKVVALNAWIENYAEQKGLVYVDYYSATKDDRGGLPPALSKDGVHPLPAGYAIMAPLAEAGIEKALK